VKDALSQLRNASPLMVNILTTGVDPFTDNIRLIQLAGPSRPVVTINPGNATTQTTELVSEVLKSPGTKVFHNAKLQLKFLRRAGLQVNGALFDTLLAHQLLTAGMASRGEALADLATDYLGERIAGNQLKNSALDIPVIKRLAKGLISDLKEAGLMGTAHLEFECIPPVAEMELNGMLLDLDKWQALSSKLQQEKARLELTLHQELGEINLASPQQLLQALRAKGLAIERTDRATLGPLRKQYRSVKDLELYRRVSKLVQAFAHAIPKHIHPSTGRIHPEYRQIGTATGRFSCRNPNLQQIPRDKAFRGCFIPSPGYKMMIADYSQIELRVAAEMSNDTRMIQAYRKRQDLHRLTAALVMDKPLDQVTKKERQAAKAVNFGLMYAMGSQSLMAYAQNTYGVEMSLQEAETFRGKFFAAYQGLAHWHSQTARSLQRETRTLAGRRRTWQDKPPLTELLNSPVQGSAADILKKALAMLPKELEGTESRINSMVHDEIILEAPVDKAQKAAQILKETMERAGRYYLKKVPVEIDVSIADSWAEK